MKQEQKVVLHGWQCVSEHIKRGADIRRMYCDGFAKEFYKANR